MFPILLKYFALHKKLSIPGIGCFTVQQEPAQFDFANRSISSPMQKVVFNADPGTVDKRLFQFIANEKGIDEVEAIRRMHDFSYHLKEDVKSNQSIELPTIGTLKSTLSTFSFEPANAFEYFPTVTAEKIVRDDAEHSILVGDEEKTNTEMQEFLQEETMAAKDRWWIYALILAVIAIAAIVFFHAMRA